MKLKIKVKGKKSYQYLSYNCYIHCEWINYQINNANIGLESNITTCGISLSITDNSITKLLIEKVIYPKFTEELTKQKLSKCVKLLQSADKDSISLGQSLLFRGGIEENYTEFMKIYENTVWYKQRRVRAQEQKTSNNGGIITWGSSGEVDPFDWRNCYKQPWPQNKPLYWSSTSHPTH